MERITVQREINGTDWQAEGRLVAATRRFAEHIGLGERQAHRLCIVIEELVANAFSHGGANRITLTMEPMGGAIRIGLEDDGAAFDLRQFVAPARPDPDSGGGSGIAMVRAWCEVIDYRPGRTRNHLDLVLRLERK